MYLKASLIRFTKAYTVSLIQYPDHESENMVYVNTFGVQCTCHIAGTDLNAVNQSQ